MGTLFGIVFLPPRNSLLVVPELNGSYSVFFLFVFLLSRDAMAFSLNRTLFLSIFYFFFFCSVRIPRVDRSATLLPFLVFVIFSSFLFPRQSSRSRWPFFSAAIAAVSTRYSLLHSAPPPFLCYSTPPSTMLYRCFFPSRLGAPSKDLSQSAVTSFLFLFRFLCFQALSRLQKSSLFISSGSYSM